ncbi:glycerol dehydrogenase [Enterococcus hulanensis]|uniref:Glycerol dehydrogenase n=1 Tax=Enterococcus hulanensis TaxID=2559929 RepID=A0ABU3F4X0_9ENTE|nr:glycerol dehydrogenase [Enterococcus hulanensis]MDT2601967.1 glycerol dehydrogenase [Enterococcus hulanensis]MDT2611238.1 glycerol dehydrogenase [Enterococcus hulanensis]MDT2615778.1 glycerol dehydrogenase [Enterococcus hulanensis]MDT2630039.1 glycerol dehydrogenase [Enterococcus hulanensis]MDT2657520.1 glycerol dehydrogenase [Enterococcus hulanensis]
MEKVFVSPMTYRQGKNVLWNHLNDILAFGQKGLLVTDQFVYQMVGERLLEELTVQGGQITKWLVEEERTAADFDYVIALGGGRAIDLGKALAFETSSCCIVVPTSASTDAPTSRISVKYQDGYFAKYDYYAQSPDLVLVDTAILIESPVHFLTAGIADGLSTSIEARTVRENSGVNTLGAAPTLAAEAIAEKCREVLFEHAEAAVEANKRHEITPAFEAVVEANTLLSGIGFESGGLSIAHALHNAMVSLWGREIKGSHGQIIALTTLQQLQIEGREEELRKYRTLFERLNLPITYEALSIFPSAEELEKVAELAFSPEDGIIRSQSLATEEEVFKTLLTFRKTREI